MLAYKLGIYLIVGRNPSAAGTFMFGLSINCVSRRKFLLQSLLKCWLYREDLHSVISSVLSCDRFTIHLCKKSIFFCIVTCLCDLFRGDPVYGRKKDSRWGRYFVLQTNQKDLVPLSRIITENLAASFLGPLSTGFPRWWGSSRVAEQTQKFCVLTHLF